MQQLIRRISNVKPLNQLSWQQFFVARRRLLIFQRMAGIPFAFGFLAAESAFLSLPVFDPTKLILGMDPLIIVGISTLSGSVLSYFLGVAVSGGLWRRFKPTIAAQLNEVSQWP